jgi:hypothetical protein
MFFFKIENKLITGLENGDIVVWDTSHDRDPKQVENWSFISLKKL